MEILLWEYKVKTGGVDGNRSKQTKSYNLNMAWSWQGEGWSVLPPSHPTEESPSALKSKTCINDLYRACRSHTHWVSITHRPVHVSQDTDRTGSLLFSLIYDERQTCIDTLVHRYSVTVYLRLMERQTTGSQLHIPMRDLIGACRTNKQHEMNLKVTWHVQ